MKMENLLTDGRFRKIAFICMLCIALNIALGATAPDLAQAQSDVSSLEPAAKINAANQLVRDGKFTDAIDAYSEIEANTEQVQLDYNLAIAHYRNGDFDAAATLFSDVAGAADKSLAFNSQYNLGNCHYSKALQRVQPAPKQVPPQIKPEDKEAAIGDLRSAISAYRSSLRGNPDNPDARANIELAVALIKKLSEEKPPEEDQKEEQENQEQENQEQENQDQKNQDQKNEDKNEDQQNENDQKEKEADQQEKDQQQENKEENDSEENDQQKDEKSEQGEKSQQDSSGQQGKSEDTNESESGSDSKNETEPQQSQDPKQDGQPQGKSQRNNRPQGDSGDPSDDSKKEPGTEGEKDDKQGQKSPAGELTSDNQQQTGVADQTSEGEAGEKEMKLMTNQEALKMLQSVRDRDMLRRLKLLQRERSRRIPVDKDW
ncbi:MAG: tetratricopeptide repeat protein [Mariniblastus sp.]